MNKKKIWIILVVLLFIAFAYIILKNVILHFYDENIPILAYHVISDNPKNDMEVSTSNFERQMAFLHRHHFKVLSLEEVELFKTRKKRFDGKKIAITFDDGSESYYTKALPILKKYNFTSTNFVITGRLGKNGYLSKEQFDKLKNDKLVSLQSHSFNLHNHSAAKSNDYKLYTEDLEKNKDYHFKYYAYPFGISNENYIKALSDNDIILSFKYSPSHWMNVFDDNYTLPRVPIYNSTSFFKFVLKTLIRR